MLKLTKRFLATGTKATVETKTAQASSAGASVVSSDSSIKVQPTSQLPFSSRPVLSPSGRQSLKNGPGGRSSTSGHVVTVFGCSGFLGKYLVNQLAKSGSQVVVPYRASIEYIRDLKVMGDLGQVVPLKFDVRNEESIRDCVRNSDTVYNLMSRTYPTRNFSLYDINVEAARSIARICKESPNVERLIHVSCLNADSKSSSEILKTKGQGEIAVELEFPEAVIVRPGTLYGWEDRLLRYLGHTVTHPIKRWFTGGFIPLIDGGKHVLTPTYVNDVARGLHALMEIEDPKQVYEFYGPKSMQYKELVELFCEYARRPYSPISIPHSLFRSIVELSQISPLSAITVQDVDKWAVDDKFTESAGTFSDVGVTPRNLESIAITFIRRYRSLDWVSQPATVDEIKYWKRTDNERVG